LAGILSPEKNLWQTSSWNTKRPKAKATNTLESDMSTTTFTITTSTTKSSSSTFTATSINDVGNSALNSSLSSSRCLENWL
jgi:hypothetical protein